MRRLVHSRRTRSYCQLSRLTPSLYLILDRAKVLLHRLLIVLFCFSRCRFLLFFYITILIECKLDLKPAEFDRDRLKSAAKILLVFLCLLLTRPDFALLFVASVSCSKHSNANPRQGNRPNNTNNR